MTDAELNLAIAKLVYLDEEITTIGDSDAVEIYRFRGLSKFTFDYCNNWNDLMPRVVKHGHWFYVDSKISELEANCTVYRVEHNGNPQRALAECLLKVLQEKSDE